MVEINILPQEKRRSRSEPTAFKIQLLSRLNPPIKNLTKGPSFRLQRILDYPDA